MSTIDLSGLETYNTFTISAASTIYAGPVAESSAADEGEFSEIDSFTSVSYADGVAGPITDLTFSDYETANTEYIVNMRSGSAIIGKTDDNNVLMSNLLA